MLAKKLGVLLTTGEDSCAKEPELFATDRHRPQGEESTFYYSFGEFNVDGVNISVECERKKQVSILSV